MTHTPAAFTARRWPLPPQAETLTAAVDAAAATMGPAVTPWFDWTVEPVQIGVYQRQNSVGIVAYSLWDGENWMWNQRSPAMAARETMPSPMQQMPWRGLAQPPAEGYGQAAIIQEAAPC